MESVMCHLAKLLQTLVEGSWMTPLGLPDNKPTKS